jgi:hypothetical protein
LTNTTETGIATTANSLTTGIGQLISSSSLTSGSLLRLTSTSTATNGEVGLNISMSGTNANASRASTGLYISQTKVGGNTGSNYGIDVVLSGAGNLTNKIGVRSVISGGTNWGFNNFAGYFSNTTIGSTQIGLYADATGGNSVSSIGVYGKTTSPYNNASGYGVYGENTNVASNGFSYGVYGSASNNATFASGSTGYGVYGISGGAGNGTRYGGHFTALGYAVGGFSASPVCIGLYASASGGATDNFGLIVANGKSGFLTTAPTSSVHIVGSLSTPVSAKTGNYTLTTTDHTVTFDGTSLTATLPTASTCNGRMYVLVNYNVTSLTVSTYKDFTNSNSTTLLTSASLWVQSDGTNWRQIK